MHKYYILKFMGIWEASTLECFFYSNRFQYELSGNNTLIDLLGNLNDMIFVTATKALSGAPRRQSTIREHAAILEALRCRNADQAVRAMKLHMEQTHCNVQHNTSID